jgi:hypothetical protein
LLSAWLSLSLSLSRCKEHAWCGAGRETLAAEPHVDRGLLTVVWDDAPGLQVRQTLVVVQLMSQQQNPSRRHKRPTMRTVRKHLQFCSCQHTPVPKLHMTHGLQVQSPAGDWQPITLKQNQVAVFAGETLQHATCGRIKPAVHRVVLDPATYQTVVRHLIRPRLTAFFA